MSGGAAGAKVYLSRRYRFSSSHRLHTEALNAAENTAAFGKCNNPHGHGHNYIVEVTMSGGVDGATGMVTNLADLDRFAEERLLSRFRDSNLNRMECFAATVPTTENLLLEVERIFRPYPYAHLERVRIEETSNNAFETREQSL